MKSGKICQLEVPTRANRANRDDGSLDEDFPKYIGRKDVEKALENLTSRQGLPCRAEYELICHLADVIEETGLSTKSCVPVFEEPPTKQCCRCGNMKGDRWRRTELAVELFTVGQGGTVVIVGDYYCEKCSEWNVCTGNFHGIVTA